MADAEERRRLSPLVVIGYRIYRGEIAVPAPAAARDRAPVRGCSLEAYRQGLEHEIEGSFSSRPGTLEHLVSAVRSGALTGFTEDDCSTAVGVLDSLLREALFVESSLGDGADAVAELEREVPGLPPSLYADLIGYYGYVNR